MSKKANFIKSSDKETIDKLRKLGFKELSKDGDVVTFLNDKALTFDEKNQKVIYSNTISV